MTSGETKALIMRSLSASKIPIAALFASLFFTACGTSLAFLAERSRTEAQVLQEDCRQSGWSDPLIVAADSLLSEANRHWKEGDALPAQQSSERASALYRLAMAKHEAQTMQKAVDSTQTARVREEERVTTYREFLNEARALKKP